MKKYDGKKLFNWVILMLVFAVLPQYPGLMLVSHFKISFIPLLISAGLCALMLGYIGIMWKKFCVNDRLGSIVFMVYSVFLNTYVLLKLI